MNRQVSGTRFGKIFQVSFRLLDHQMHIEWQLCGSAQSRHHERPDGDIGHEAPIHHVHVQPVGARAFTRDDHLVEVKEIRGDDRWSDDDSFHV